MRGLVTPVARVALAVVALTFITNCGDDPAAPEQDGVQRGGSGIALATASDGNGLSITTDKDDYAPGDTVWFTGAGWTAGDSVDIVLVDDPTQDLHQWTVGISADGTFRDSTYVVNAGDFGVTFTLTATSRTNPQQSLTVTFTDASPQVNAITLSPARPNPSQAPFAATFTVTINGQAPAGDQWKATGWRIYPKATPADPIGSYTCVDTPNLTSATTSPPATLTLTAPSSAGQYTLDVQTYNDDGTTCSQKIGNGRTLDFTVGTSDLTISKSHTGNFTAGSTGTYTIMVTNAGTGVTDGPVTVTDVLPTGFSFNSGSGTNWTCSQTPAGTASCSRGGGNPIAAGTSASAITLVVNVASNAVSSITNTASVAIGAGGAESNTGNNQASDPTTIVPAVAPASKLAFTTDPLTTVVGQCSPKITVQTQNATGGATNPSANVTVNLTSTSTGGTFYSDANCGSSITSRQILTTGNSADFYYSDTKAGSPKLTAMDGAANLTAANQTETVNPAATATSISSVSPSPATFGVQVTVNYSVTVTSPGSGTPTGTVTVKDGATTLCSNAVATGNCTFYPDGGGSLNLTATYGGDANFAASTSSPATPLTVNPAPTTTTIGSVSPSPSTFGQEVTVNFGVVPTNTGAGYNYKSLSPSGTVQVKAGATVLCSASVATGECTFFPAGAGTLSLVASYAGNANFASSTSSPATSLTVNRAPTTTTIGTISPVSPAFGQQVTVNFTVAATNTGAGYDYGSVVPTGTVQVKDGATLLCSAIVATGNCKFYPAGAGTLSLKAYYVGVSPDFDGDANFLASSTPAASSLTVTRAPTTTAITSPAANASYILNQPVEVDFTVGPKNTGTGYDYGSVVPTGSVQIKNGTTLLCSATVAVGNCTFTASAVGGYTLKAYYLGDASSYPGDDQNADANFLASQSSEVHITVSFNFAGLFAPVDAVPTLNSAKAGQAIPLKWRLTDYSGAPVLNFSAVALGVAVSGVECSAAAGIDTIEEYAGNSGLQNLGDGYYQYNWKSPANYVGTCKRIGLNLGEGFTRTPLGYFQFKK